MHVERIESCGDPQASVNLRCAIDGDRQITAQIWQLDFCCQAVARNRDGENQRFAKLLCISYLRDGC